MMSLILFLLDSRIMMSLGETISSASTRCQRPSAERTLTGEPSSRLRTRRAMSIPCLSRESGLPGPKGSSGMDRSVVGSLSPPVLNGQSHSIEPELSCFSGLPNRVWGVA